jgi:hypothetical protein
MTEHLVVSQSDTQHPTSLYTEDQHRELSRHPHSASLFEYLERSCYELNVALCYFFFRLRWRTSTIEVSVPRGLSPGYYVVRLRIDYHSCNCSLCSVPRREQESTEFVVPLKEAAIIIPYIISEIERLK